MHHGELPSCPLRLQRERFQGAALKLRFLLFTSFASTPHPSSARSGQCRRRITPTRPSRRPWTRTRGIRTAVTREWRPAQQRASTRTISKPKAGCVGELRRANYSSAARHVRCCRDDLSTSAAAVGCAAQDASKLSGTGQSAYSDGFDDSDAEACAPSLCVPLCPVVDTLSRLRPLHSLRAAGAPVSSWPVSGDAPPSPHQAEAKDKDSKTAEASQYSEDGFESAASPAAKVRGAWSVEPWLRTSCPHALPALRPHPLPALLVQAPVHRPCAREPA